MAITDPQVQELFRSNNNSLLSDNSVEATDQLLGVEAEMKKFRLYQRHKAFKQELLSPDLNVLPALWGFDKEQQSFKPRSNFFLRVPGVPSETGLEGDSSVGKPLRKDHPLEQWRLASKSRPSLTAVGVAFCVHLPVLDSYVKGAPEETPAMLVNALEEAGYSGEVLSLLKLAYYLWRAGGLN